MEPNLPKDKKLIHFSELKEAVIRNAVKNVPATLKGRARKSCERTLLEFQ